MAPAMGQGPLGHEEDQENPFPLQIPSLFGHFLLSLLRPALQPHLN